MMMRSTLLLVAGVTCAAACTASLHAEAYLYVRPRGYVRVTSACPPIQEETDGRFERESRPDVNAIWVSGHWTWENGWTWVRGQWVVPQAGYVWEPPVCVAQGGEYHLYPGYYRGRGEQPPAVYREPGHIRVHRPAEGDDDLPERIVVRAGQAAPTDTGSGGSSTTATGTIDVHTEGGATPAGGGSTTVTTRPRASAGAQAGGTTTATTRPRASAGAQAGGTTTATTRPATPQAGATTGGSAGGSTTATTRPRTPPNGAAGTEGGSTTATPQPGAATPSPGSGAATQPATPAARPAGVTVRPTPATPTTPSARPATPTHAGRPPLQCSLRVNRVPANGYVTIAGTGFEGDDVKVLIGGAIAEIRQRTATEITARAAHAGNVRIQRGQERAACGTVTLITR